MATFCKECEKKGMVVLAFSKGFCKSHQYLKEGYDKRSINQKSIDRKKEELKNNPQKRKDEPEGLNSEVVFVSPSPESFDGKENNHIVHDEMGMWEEPKGIDESLVNLSADLDMVMSLFIRYKYANRQGLVKCFCCPVVLPIKEITNGHYIKRANRAMRFLESNLRPQCKQCNNDHNYDEIPFTNALEAEIPGITSDLKELSKTTYKATRSELKSLLYEYRGKLDMLKHKIIVKK